MKNALGLLLVATLVSSCSYFESLEKKRIRACTDEIKLGLNDPNSFEFLSSRPIDSEKVHRIELKFTAKNKMGGRVRGEEVCGFLSAESAEMDPKDYLNEIRSMARTMSELGITLK